MVWLFTSHQPTREFAMQNMWLLIVAIIVMFVTIIMISCCEGVRRATPHNFIVLGLFTLAEGFVVAFGTMRFEAEIVRSLPPSFLLICFNENPSSFLGPTSGWVDCGGGRRADHFCDANQMGFHYDGRNPVRLPLRPDLLRSHRLVHA